MKKTVYVLAACLCLFVSCEKRVYTAMEYYRAILTQDVKTVKNVLKQHKNPVIPYTESERLQLLAEFGGETENTIFTEIHPLLLAAHTGNEQILTELLAHKVDVHHKNEYGQTALMFAVKSDLPAAVSILLKAGANVDSVDSNMMSAIHYAIKSRSLEMVTLLFSGDQTLLSFAAEVNAPDIIRFFAAKGISIEEKNSDGQTALFYAVENDAFDAAKTLIELGAQVNLKDNKNCSPLFLSVNKKSGADFIHLFAAAGAMFEVSDTENTILSHSIQYGTPEVTTALLEVGVPADREALHTAIAVDSAETIQLLITAGADIMDTSILEEAVKNDSSEITALLLEAGALPGECLYLAKSSTVFRLLLDSGADVFVNQKLLINRIISCPVNMLEDFFTIIFDGISHDGKRDLTTLEISTAFCLLYAAAGTGRLDLIKAFANDAFDIKQIPPLSDSEKSLLAMAARGNSLTVVSYLLENGFDADNSPDNALYEAVQHENAQPLVSLLLEAGADANGSNNLFLPLCVSLPEYTKQLLNAGAQVNFIDGSNNTPLTSAVRKFENGDNYLAEKVVMLLEAGADPYIPAEKNAIDMILKGFDEESPREGWTDIAQAVVTREKSADLPLVQNIIPYAIKNNNENAARALAALGANINVVDTYED